MKGHLMKRAGSGLQPQYRVPALDKGLDIMELLSRGGKPQTLADMARELSRTSSELFRTVGALERRDYIIRDPTTGAYRLSMKLYEMSHTHSPVESLIAAARGPMRELVDAARESCHLSVLERGRLVVVLEEPSTERVRLSVEVGSTVSAVESASGRVLLAHLQSAERNELLNRDPDFTNLSQRRRAAIRKELEQIRAQGYTIAPSAYPFIADVAVFVGAPDTDVAAALAIPRLAGGVNDGREQKLRKLMQRCAREICRQIRLSAPERAPGD
jgi:DNA-binding IclR family transcriptional regulator